MNSKKKISVITVVYNDKNGIEKTILSVIANKHNGVEYIIIDGKSTDGTIDIIKKYDRNIDKWISEPDKGIYDAMNKGLQYASGKWVIFINVGDTLLRIPQILWEDKFDLYSAILCPVESERNVIYPSFGWKILYKNTIPHQGAFYNRKEKILYNLNYKVFADYDLNLSLYKTKKKIFIHNEVVAYHSSDGISNNKKYAYESYSIVYKRNGLFYLLLSFLHKKIQGIRVRLK